MPNLFKIDLPGCNCGGVPIVRSKKNGLYVTCNNADCTHDTLIPILPNRKELKEYWISRKKYLK